MSDLSWVEPLRNDQLTALFRGFSFMGEEVFLLLFICVGYWCFNKKLFRDLAVMVCFTTLINFLLKAVFAVPRPTIEYLVNVDYLYSFPSGHVQLATVFWLLLAVHFRKAWFWWASIFIITGIGMARIYLGVHYPSDVFVGLILGVLTVAGYEFYRNTTYWMLFSRKKSLVLFATMIFLGLYYLVFKNGIHKGVMMAGGLMLGMIVGHVIESKRCKYREPSGYGAKLVIAVCAVTATFLVRWFLKTNFLENSSAKFSYFVCYAALGLFIALIVPWVIQRIRKRYGFIVDDSLFM